MAAWLLGIFVLVLFAGLALIRLGWRGRRINRDPVCKDCGFNLHAFRLPDMHGVPPPALAPAAAESAAAPSPIPITVTCPECGGGLKRAKAIRIGERKRMPLVAMLGLFLSLAVMAPIVFVGVSLARGTSYAKHLPLGVLLILGSGDAGDIPDELQSRILAGSLTPDQLKRVAHRAMEVQGDWAGSWHSSWGDVFEAAASATSLPPDVRSRWAQQSMDFSAVPKPEINEGDPLPIRVRCTATRLGSGSTTQLSVFIESIQVDGRVYPYSNSIGGYREKQAYFQASGAGRGRNFTMVSNDLVCEVPGLKPGSHECVVRLALNANASSGSAAPGEVRYLSIPGRFTVRPAAEPITKALEPTDRQRQRARKFLAMDTAVFALQSYSTNGGGVLKPNAWNMQVSPDWQMQPETPLAMRIVLKDAGGNEVDLGFLVTRTHDEPTGRGSSVDIENRLPAGFRLVGPVTVIFRPDLATAKRRFDASDFYGEEVRFDGLPLKWSSEFFGKPYFATPEEAVEYKQSKAAK